MAKAKRIVNETITLTLSGEEAKVLMDVCENVGGCATSSPRGHTDAILNALYEVGISIDEHQFPQKDNSTGIYYLDYKRN